MRDFSAYKHLLNQNYGADCCNERTVFRMFALETDDVKLAIYENSYVQHRKEYMMQSEGPDIWSLAIEGDYHGMYYTYLIMRDGKRIEVVDPYTLSTSVNSHRGAIIDLKRTNPDGYDESIKLKTQKVQQTVIYELHLRDFTMDPDGGIVNRGKFLGLTETGTTFNNLPTGLDHLVDLGVTHVHILPIADFGSVKDIGTDNYNWGYDPIYFNAPEGSYSTQPDDPVNRIKELKMMVQALHAKGLRVIIDVVYNHTYDVLASSFTRLAPHVFYREKEGVLTNGSGVGCELQTEHPLVSEFIVNSLMYWAQEYQVDGFRFDLLALYDVACVKRISEVLHAYRPDLLLYGEPWVGGDSGLAVEKQFLKGAQKTTQVALFNDDFRNAIKGDNDGTGLGIVQGNEKSLEQLRLGVSGSIAYSSMLSGFADSPLESINYVSSHDNLILRDKLERTLHQFDKVFLMNTNRLAISIILTSFGIPFIQAGTELYRSKKHQHNTYNMGDEINQIHWKNKEKYYSYYAYIRDLIRFRKKTGIFEWNKTDDIRKNLSFIESECFAYRVSHGDYVYAFYHNYHDEPVLVNIKGTLEVFFFNAIYEDEGMHKKSKKNEFLVEAKSSLIIRQTKKTVHKLNR